MMRTSGEVMTESRPTSALTRPSPVTNGRTSPMSSPDKKMLSNAANGAIEGINRAQLTLQELQDLTERQREQILYNSQELMEKQQQLMRMHQDYRARLKAQQQATSKVIPKSLQSQHDSHQPHAHLPQSPMAPRSPRSLKGKGADADQYAKMLRQTYQNMGRIQSKNQLQHNVDVKKFNNIELARELEKVRSVFAAKQSELADAVKKVDILTHELEQRKNGDHNSSVPTPERINRRKKIQAAKDELYRLQNELIIRNEMNSQQTHQLQLQRDIIAEKKQELRELNSRMTEIGNALRRNGGSYDPRRSLNYSSPQGGLFNGTYLQDTLSRRKLKQPPLKQDINANVIPSQSNSTSSRPQFKNGLVNGYTPPKQKAFDQSPVSGNQVWRNEPQKSLNIHTNNQNKPSPLPSPSSSVSSLSSLSSASATPDDTSKMAFPFGKDAPPAPPPRTTPIGVLIDHNQQPSEAELEKLRAQKIRINELQQELREKTNISLKSYNDSKLSEVNDDYKYKQYSDAKSSYSYEVLNTVKPAIKPKPPVISPKPTIPTKPTVEKTEEKPDEQSLENIPVIVNSLDNDWPSPPLDENIATEPDEFELSFADIDELKEQTDLWSNSGSTASQSSYESDGDSIENAVVPVVISVSPDKMPPPILMKPDKPRKQKRNVILDPFALLLDSALEGEMEVVKKTLMQVPDPSKPNPEGITALHNAVCGNHKEVVRYLVEVACDINAADNNGWTPLHCAAFYNDKELCRYLVEHGASVFATTYTDYQTPAHKCSRLDDNYDECFAYLHECKENVGRINNGLVYAIYDYTGENEDELSFINGDELTVLRRGDNNEKEWWWARDRKGNTGYVPCNLIGNFPRVEAAV